MIRGLFLLIVAAAAIFLLFRLLLTASPARLAGAIRTGGGVFLLMAAAGLLLLKQFAFALPLGLAGLGLLRRHFASGLGSSGPRRSTVRSTGLQMTLDHESGELDGEVLTGNYKGKRLSQLQLSELFALAQQFSADAESLRLLESYLDRARPGWRDDMEADADRGRSAAGGTSGMSAQEAYEILGLQPGAGETEIRQAHRRLMKQVHPDRGGSAALAARINQAKERLLRKHR